MKQESRDCQNCKKNFRIDSEDFNFYEKIKVPPPTFCPDCRYQRRMMLRNERVLYKRDCDLCRKSMISVYAQDAKVPVYCQPCWWSDNWDPMEYGIDYDHTRTFFEQLRELQLKVPHMGLVNEYTKLVNSDYVNQTGSLKNCYLCFDADFGENVSYAKTIQNVKDALDIYLVGESELLYEAINCGKSSRMYFSQNCESSHDIYFSYDLRGCSNCIGCVGLRNKQYHIFNELYSREEYEKKLKEFNLGSWNSVQGLLRQVGEFRLKFPNKFFYGHKVVNSTGEYIYNSKNANDVYVSRNVEDGRYCQFMIGSRAKDVYDYTEWGENVEKIYDSITVGAGASDIKFCQSVWENVERIAYSMYVHSSSDVFGCVSTRKKKHCILNKQYSKGEYEQLKDRIVAGMNSNPYVDSMGRVWKYGEFFPYDLSLFAYNETTAIQYYPLSKEETEKNGWAWREPAPSSHKITMPAENIPDHIDDISENILSEVLGCLECKKAFLITGSELQLLKRFGFPVPRKCPECRFIDRLTKTNMPDFHNRSCQCGGEVSDNQVYSNTTNHFHGVKHCPNKFQTAYGPDRREIVYCKECYESEIA